jgi:hypothetical protein
MWNEPAKEHLTRIPKLYATEGVPEREKVIHLHFFIGGCDWYAAEFDGEDIFFGFCILNKDYEMAEWGYISFTEMKEISVNGIEIDCEVNWRPRRAVEIPKMREARGWSEQENHSVLGSKPLQ